MKHMSVIKKLLSARPKALFAFNGTSSFVDYSGNAIATVSPSGSKVPVRAFQGIDGAWRLTAAQAVAHTIDSSKDFTVILGAREGYSSANILQLGSGLTVVKSNSSVSATFTFDDNSVKSIGGEVRQGILSIAVLRASDTLSIYADGEFLESYDIPSPRTIKTFSTTTLAPAASVTILAYYAAYDYSVRASDIIAIAGARVSDQRPVAVSAIDATDIWLSRDSIPHDSIPLTSGLGYQSTNAYYQDGAWLAAVDSLGLSIASSVTISLPVTETAAGAFLEWDYSRSTTAEISFDAGGTWSTAYRNFTYGRGTTATQVLVRFTMSSGLPSQVGVWNPVLYVPDSVLDSGSQSTQIFPRTPTERVISALGSVSFLVDTSQNLLFSRSLGAFFGADGRVRVSANSADAAETVNGVEMWYSPSSGDLSGTKYLLNSPATSTSITVVAGKLNFSGFSSVWVNKVLTTTNTLTLVSGMHYEIVAKHTTATNSEVVFGNSTSPVSGAMQRMSLIYETINQTLVDNLFDGQQGVQSFSVPDTASLTITDNGVTFYELPWTAGYQ